MNTDIEFIDLMDTIAFTVGKGFISKWKIKYGERLIRLFQIKILDSLKVQKPIKLQSLIKFLVNDSGYNPEIVKNFLEDIDYRDFYPIILGNEINIDTLNE